MKKISAVIMLSLAAMLPVFSVPVPPAEPLVILSLAAPAITAAENPGGSVDLSMLDEAMLLMLPEEIMRSGISLSGILSDNIIKIANEAFKAAMFYSGFEDAYLIGASGTVSSSFDSKALEEEGLLRAYISFDDAAAIYKFGSRTSSTSLDGTMCFTASLLSDPLASLFIDTGDIVISGSSAYQNNVLEIRIDLNEDAVLSYFDIIGIDIDEARSNAIMLLLMFGGDEYGDLLIGEDLDAMQLDEITGVLREKNMLDVLDAAAFFIEAGSDPSMDIPGMISVAIEPSLYLNGAPVPGVDLEKAMNRLFDIYTLAEKLE